MAVCVLTQGRLVDFLAHTVWGPPLAKGLPRFESEANLFPLEMSLDLFVYASLWQGLEGLSRADRRIAGDILGSLTDIINITWTGRLRDLYGLPPEETYQYLLEAGSFISPAARRDLAFAASTEESRPILNGVLWELRSDRMRMVATNGHRLARMDVPLTAQSGATADLIVPPKALEQIRRLFKADEEIEIATQNKERQVIVALRNKERTDAVEQQLQRLVAELLTVNPVADPINTVQLRRGTYQ